MLDPDASAARCGADYDPVEGNLAVTPMLVSTFALQTPTSLPVQVVHLAPSLSSPDGGTASVTARFGVLLDADVPLGTAHYLAAGNPATMDLSMAIDLVDWGISISYANADGGAPVTFSMPLTAVSQVSAPETPPRVFLSNSAFLLAVLGDATDASQQYWLPDGAPNPAFDGRRLHLLLLPNPPETTQHVLPP